MIERQRPQKYETMDNSGGAIFGYGMEMDRRMFYDREAPLDDHLNLYQVREKMVDELEDLSSTEGTLNVYFIGPTAGAKTTAMFHVFRKLFGETPNENEEDRQLRERLKAIQDKTGKPTIFEWYSTATGYNRGRSKGEITSRVGYFQPHEVDATNRNLLERSDEADKENPGLKVKGKEFPIIGYPDWPFGVPSLLEDIKRAKENPGKNRVIIVAVNPELKLQKNKLQMREQINASETSEEAQKAAEENAMKPDQDPLLLKNTWGGVQAAENNDAVARKRALKNKAKIRTYDSSIPDYDEDFLLVDSPERTRIMRHDMFILLTEELGVPKEWIYFRDNDDLNDETNEQQGTFDVPYQFKEIGEACAVWDIEKQQPKYGFSLSFKK